MTHSPILEFDPARAAILEPCAPGVARPVPERAVLCFFADVIARLKTDGLLTELGALGSEIGPNPVYALEHAGQRLLVAHPGVGAPLAVGFMEELIAAGVRRFTACGGCGVLDRSIAVGYPVVLTSAVRDEGTSYHYLPPGRETAPTPAALEALEQALQAAHQPYLRGKSWTTDAIYRETAAKRELRLAEGCLVVEMEAAAFFAVAAFRGVEFAQVVYGGDLVEPEGWDRRAWHDRKADRQRLFWLAADAAARM